MLKKIHIIGSGAIGGFVGAHLTKRFGKKSIILVDSDEEHVKAIRDKRLRILDHGKKENQYQEVDVNIVTHDEIKKENLESVIISTKSYSNDESLKGLRTEVDMLVLQNGYDERIERFGNAVRGIEFGFACKVQAPGAIFNAVKGRYVLGISEKEPNQRAMDWSKLLNFAGIGNKTTNKLNGYLWSKLLINSALNPLTAIRDYSFKELMDDPKTRTMFTRLYREGYPIAKRQAEESGEKLGSFMGPPGLVNYIFKHTRLSNVVLSQVAKKFGNVESSMLQDIRKGRQTEVDYINGEIIRLGKEYGIKTPFNAHVSSSVKKLESGGLNSGAKSK